MNCNQFQRQLLKVAGPCASITSCTSSEWKTATFTGNKVQVSLLFHSKQSLAAFRTLVNHGLVDVNLSGAVLIDMIEVEYDDLGIHHALTIEATTVENA